MYCYSVIVYIYGKKVLPVPQSLCKIQKHWIIVILFVRLLQYPVEMLADILCISWNFDAKFSAGIYLYVTFQDIFPMKLVGLSVKSR